MGRNPQFSQGDHERRTRERREQKSTHYWSSFSTWTGQSPLEGWEKTIVINHPENLVSFLAVSPGQPGYDRGLGGDEDILKILMIPALMSLRQGQSSKAAAGS